MVRTRSLALTAVAWLASTLAVSAAEKVTFLIDWLPSGDKAAPYLAVQKGLFAAEGLEVTIQSGRGSSDASRRCCRPRASTACPSRP